MAVVRRGVAAATAFLLAWPTKGPAQQPSPLTPAQVIDRHTLGDPRFSPAGDRVAFTVTQPATSDVRNSDIWVYDLNAREARAFATSPRSDVAPRWSPDGATIAFISDRAGTRQVWLIAAAGGEARVLTEQKAGISGIEWSPVGSRIAFTGSEPPSDEEEARIKNKADARVVDRNVRPTRLWLIDAVGGKARMLTRGGWSFTEFAWAPDGRTIYAIGTDTPDPDRHSERIVAVSVDSGAVREVHRPRGPFGGLAVSPDGAWLSYAAAPVDGPSPHDLFIVPASGGPPRNLTAKELDRPIGSVEWKDGSSLLVTAADGFTTRFAEVSVTGGVRLLPPKAVEPVAMARARDGAVAFVGLTVTQAPELWVERAGGAAEQATHVNDRWGTRNVVGAKTLRYRSFDGREIEAAFLVPEGSTTGARVPLIVLVHGGPTGRWSNNFEAWGQMLASRGYAVLYPNIRGSTAYGHKFVEANRADWGGGDYRDVMAGVDALIANGIADSARLGVGGWSYGGYMAMWAVTQTNRFKASVAGAGMSDLASEFGTESSALYDEWFFGTPYEHQQEFIESSPITFVKRARTPTLILQGENDLTDPIGQSQQFYRGLKKYDVPTELVIYPREGHGIREEQHLLDMYDRMLAWFDRYVKGRSAVSGDS